MKVPGLQDALRGHFAGDLVGALEERVVDVFGAGDLGLDHAEVLGVRQALRLHRVRFGGCRHKRRRVFGAVKALGETLEGQALGKRSTSQECEDRLA